MDTTLFVQATISSSCSWHMIILVIAVQTGICKLSVHQSFIILFSSQNIHITMVCSFPDSSVGHHLIVLQYNVLTLVQMFLTKDIQTSMYHSRDKWVNKILYTWYRTCCFHNDIFNCKKTWVLLSPNKLDFERLLIRRCPVWILARILTSWLKFVMVLLNPSGQMPGDHL